MVTSTASGALWDDSRIYATGHAARPLSGSVWQQAAWMGSLARAAACLAAPWAGMRARGWLLCRCSRRTSRT